MLKGLKHSSPKEEHVAVLLKCLESTDEVLLAITTIDGKSTADIESQAIIAEIQKIGLMKDKIKGLVFDTTSVISGIHKGIVVQLERFVGKKLLLLACRHHIYELTSGAACVEVYGESSGPGEAIFKVMQENWSRIDKTNYEILNLSVLPRFLKCHLERILVFLESWVTTTEAKSLQLRKDYQELAVLSIMLLGGTLPSDMKFTIHAPGATSHSRWMAKIIYSLKFSLFGTQLGNMKLLEDSLLNCIKSLSIFLIAYHVKPWLTATNPANAPVYDLELYQMIMKDIDLINKGKMMSNLPPKFLRFAEAYLMKFDCHLWYLSERLCVLALFSSKVSLTEKRNLKNALLKQKVMDLKVDQNMPKLSKNTHMKDLVGPDSWTFFSLLGISTNFLKLDPKDWSDSTEYQDGENVVKKMAVVNDACERALGLITEFNTNRVTKDPKQKQFLYQTIRYLRSKQADVATSSERCTKRNIMKYLS